MKLENQLKFKLIQTSDLENLLDTINEMNDIIQMVYQTPIQKVDFNFLTKIQQKLNKSSYMITKKYKIKNKKNQQIC